MIIFKQGKSGFIKYNSEVDDINARYDTFGDLNNNMLSIYCNNIKLGKYRGEGTNQIIEKIATATLDKDAKFYMP